LNSSKGYRATEQRKGEECKERGVRNFAKVHQRGRGKNIDHMGHKAKRQGRCPDKQHERRNDG
jgi:hypothetical protein